MKRESIRRRKRSFCAMLFAVLIVFNMMPMNAFAATYTMGTDITENSNQLISPGDKVQFRGSGNVIIDGGTPVFMSDGDYYENADNSGKYYIGTKQSDVNNLLLSSVYKVSVDTDGGSAAPADSNHTHSYTWKISKEPTATSDGEEIYVCECGYIAQINILPGSVAFEADIIAKIKKAPVNGIVTIETRIWNSLSKDVRDALVERPDVTLKISFLSEGYKGIPLKVTIPTGIDRYALWDEKGWLGLCRAGSTLGYDQ